MLLTYLFDPAGLARTDVIPLAMAVGLFTVPAMVTGAVFSAAGTPPVPPLRLAALAAPSEPDSPLSPAGVEVSLTDRAGWAVCLVWTEPRPVGCDLELAEPRSRAFVRDFFTEAERRAVAGAGRAAGPREVANLIWSAKESALKVLQTGPAARHAER